MSEANKWGYPFATTMAALGCIALLLVTNELASLLAFDRQAILGGEFWRLWSGHIVHFSMAHALMDGAVLFLAGAVAERELGTRKIGLVLLLGAPAISLVLLIFVPEMTHYRGASGLSVLLAVAGGRALWQSRPALRTCLALCGMLLTLKLGFEAGGLPLEMTTLPATVQVAWQAHVLGAVFGWLSAANGWRSSVAVKVLQMLRERRDRIASRLFVADS